MKNSTTSSPSNNVPSSSQKRPGRTSPARLSPKGAKGGAQQGEESGQALDSKATFTFKLDGLWAKLEVGGKNREEWISGRFSIVASSRDSDGDGWGRLIQFEDPDGKAHSVFVPLSRIESEPNGIRADLLGKGLRLGTSRLAKDLFFSYLIQTSSNRRVHSTERVGWNGHSYVFADSYIGDPNEAVVLQSRSGAEFRTLTRGSIEEWRERVGRRCQGNSRLVLAVSAAFAAPLLTPLGEEGGGFHFCGTSSCGKTTTLIVSGSVFGGGSSSGFVRTWSTSRNGLEQLAETHNDCLLPLDELALIDPRDAGEAAYQLTSGEGKQRMSKGLGAMRLLHWKVLIVSSGEIRLADHIETAGKKARGGQTVRLVDVPADAGMGMGMFEEMHGVGSPALLAQQLREAALSVYGQAAREFLQLFVTSRESSLGSVRENIDAFLADHVPANACGEVHRAARRFAIVAAAGELATELGMTGWTARDATWGVGKCFADWLAVPRQLLCPLSDNYFSRCC